MDVVQLRCFLVFLKGLLIFFAAFKLLRSLYVGDRQFLLIRGTLHEIAQLLEQILCSPRTHPIKHL